MATVILWSRCFSFCHSFELHFVSFDASKEMEMLPASAFHLNMVGFQHVLILMCVLNRNLNKDAYKYLN